ncbi:hypothetical protein [Hymenobacter persicinus]|uniref:PepSY domain-containing protein n=1 Tax=Hymenobacter persicinus TaxID=2025506 RepID=A0A4Q5LAD1_9BACT|nr:hypothetical protein [Hymenobacter persicinus]RYU77849.1 hypothetical protein EWM57_16470 [Hymenobacter persicinus]
MKKSLFLLLPALLSLASCQQNPAATTEAAATPGAGASAPAAVSTGAATEAEARAAVSRYVQALPNVALYQTDSARAVDVDTHWQVLVPRTDWARRMPNKAAFEVNKQTGAVTTRPVK